jgi:hypothetical protein
MRRLLVGLLLGGLVIPAMALKPVGVQEFEETIEASKSLSDGALSHKIDGLELTERLSAVRFAALTSAMPGKRSQQSLMRLADESAFLPIAASDVEDKPAPEIHEMNEIFSRAVLFAKAMYPRLPNFFATRDAVQFLEMKPVNSDGEERMAIYDRLHPIGTSNEIMLYRDRKEVVENVPGKRKRQVTGEGGGLVTRGLFGPIVGMLLNDSMHGAVTWLRWERGKDTPLATYRFVVPQERSHYEVEFCCFRSFSGMNNDFKRFSAYHGEIAIDPVSGAILRLMIVADMEALDPVRKSGILVDYEPMDIGGSSYVCPTRSVSMLVAYKQGQNMQETTMTDARYLDYHRFGTESTIITDLPEDAH